MLCDVKREPRYATGQAIKFLENSKQVTTVPQGFKRQAGTAKRYTYNCMVHFFPSIYSWPTLLGPHILKQSTSENINKNMWKVIVLAIYLATNPAFNRK